MPDIDTLCEPAANLWGHLLENNQTQSQKFLDLFSRNEIQYFRQAILDEAILYTHNLRKTALMKTILISETCGAKTADKIIMTGHQPNIYHTGIQAKYEALNTFAKDTNTAAINVIIDTDTGTGGLFHYPNSETSISSVDISNNNPLYLFQQIADKNFIETAFDSITSSLNSLSSKLVQRIDPVKSFYTQVSGMLVSEANTIVRRTLTSSEYYYDIPLSVILKSSYIQTLFSNILSDHDNFETGYNQSLHKYRDEHKIKNAANPFPDLKENETLFWLIDPHTQSRSSYYLGDIIENEKFLAPKAFIITLILRYCLSDLFIHGRGGAKYDQFLDFWVSDHYKMHAPAFVTASADTYLFSDKIERYEQYVSTLSQRRNISAHISKHLDADIFNDAEQADLQELTNQKNILLSALKKPDNTHAERQHYGTQIKKIDTSIKKIVNYNLKIENEANLANINEKTLYYREFPFFFFT